MQPSKALREEFRKECQPKCQKYNYWWTTKSSYAAWNLMAYDKCIKSCVEKTILKQKPSLQNIKD